MKLKHLVVMVSLFSVACESPPASVGHRGSVQLSLESATLTGGRYHLYPARFEIAGDDGSLNVHGEESEPYLSVDLPAGDYSVTLQKGWGMTFTESEGADPVPVDAKLATPMPVAVSIRDQRITEVTLQFRVGENAVSFGDGQLRVDFEVHQCDPFQQAGCLDDEKCTWLRPFTETYGETRCVPLERPSIGLFGSCSMSSSTVGLDNCGAGLICHDGQCHEPCQLDDASDECGCSTSWEFFDDWQDGGICQQTCFVLEQDCAPDRACTYSPADGSRCFPPQGAAPGGPCSYPNSCTKGYACDRANLENDGICRSFCALDDPSSCPSGYSCEANPMVAPSHAGVCRPMP